MGHGPLHEEEHLGIWQRTDFRNETAPNDVTIPVIQGHQLTGGGCHHQQFVKIEFVPYKVGVGGVGISRRRQGVFEKIGQIEQRTRCLGDKTLNEASEKRFAFALLMD